MVGVAAFFTLSGFLITSLLVEERRASGTVDLRRFYARRARRLLPALPLVLAFIVAVDVSRGLGGEAPGNVLAALAYLSNYWQVGHDGGAFRHLWSLAVEEHFYLLWPALMLVCGRRLVPIAAGLAAGSLALRLWLTAPDNVETYRLTHLRLDGLLLGCLLALVIYGRDRPHVVRPSAQMSAATALVGMWWVTSPVVSAAVVPFLASICAAVVIAGQLERPNRILTWTPLRRLGVVSYGVYLWHYPITVIVRTVTYSSPLRFLAVSVLSVLAAELSYRVVESRFLRPRSDDLPEPHLRVDLHVAEGRRGTEVIDAGRDADSVFKADVGLNAQGEAAGDPSVAYPQAR